MHSEMTGSIFNIQRYSIHDGPGIRSTVFFKGCPLRCFWCQNPESQPCGPTLRYNPAQCTGCGFCIPACPRQAIFRTGMITDTDREKCDACGKCVGNCLQKARKIEGRKVTVAEVMKELRKDEHIYEVSGGGVTLSGGDPLMQPEFALAVLSACKEEYYHTAIETSAFAGWDVMGPVVEACHYVLMDIKAVDPVLHRKGTGIDNAVILQNAAHVAESGKDFRFRMPLIPGFNDSIECVQDLKRFVTKDLGITADHVELLKYNKLAEDKYTQIGRKEDQQDLEVQSEEYFAQLNEILYS